MALERKDRTRETTTTTGTGTLNLSGTAPSGFRIFASAVTSGATVRYLIESVDSTEWEVGEGIFTNATPDTLSRVTIYASSNANSLVNFSAGEKVVSLTLTARDEDVIGEDVENAITDSDAVTDPTDAGVMAVVISGVLKKITWANLKATLLTYFQEITNSLLQNHDGWQNANETWAIYSENKADGDIDPTTDLVTVAVDIQTGTQLVWTSAAPTGLSINTIYYAIRNSATTIKFASSLTNAQAGTAIDITADGSGTRTLNILNFIKIAGVDSTGKYQKGDKFKLTNNSVISYHYVLSVTKPASDTIIEITGKTWLVYSSAITLPYYSKIASPQGLLSKSICQIKRTTAQTIPNASFTTIDFTQLVFNIGSAFSDDLTNNGIIVNESGVHQLVFLVNFADTTLGGTRLVQIIKNGVNQLQVPLVNDQTTGHRTGLSVTFMFELNKGDIISLKLYQDTGGNLDTKSDGLFLNLEKII